VRERTLWGLLPIPVDQSVNSIITSAKVFQFDSKLKLNLDSSGFVTLISDASPTKDLLIPLMAVAEFYISNTAFNELVIGKPDKPGGLLYYGTRTENARAALLLGFAKPVADAPSANSLRITPSDATGVNDIIIFGTGESLGMSTFTADARFVRTAANKPPHVTFNPPPIVVYPIPLTGR
jgi:Protein of unknown function (DUF1308)